MNREKIAEIFGCKILKSFPCGSRITCNPPPTTTDEDWLVKIRPCDMVDLDDRLEKQGFILGGSVVMEAGSLDAASEGKSFWSYKKGDINFIVTTSYWFCEKFLLGTLLSKKLNIMEKKNRISLFQAILYGKKDFWT